MISVRVAHKGETHKKIVDTLREFVRVSRKSQQTRLTQWQKNEERMRGYIPEKDHDRLRRNKRELEGTPEYTTIMLPYSYAVAMTAHSYLSTVFLSRTPVFQYEGGHGEAENQVMAVEALIRYQQINAYMLANLFIWLQDAPKYGEAWLGNYWVDKKKRVGEIVEVQDKYLGIIPGKMKRKKVVREVQGYKGNQLYNISPKKVLTDPRFPRNRYQEGEFVAVETTVTQNQLEEGKETGRYINVEHAARRPDQHIRDADQAEEAANIEEPDTSDLTKEHSERVSDVYEVYEIYATINPKKWGLGSRSQTEKWVFTVRTDFSVVLEARPLGFLHDEYPLLYVEVEPESYAQFSRSLLEVFDPVQNTLDWLVNSHLFNVRQVLNNQFVLDPSRVVERDLENGQPGKAIRLKPSAYGTDVRTALQQLQVGDVTASHLNDMGMMFQMGERLGISDSVMGISAPSSRRTASEIRGQQTFSTSRLKTIAEYMSATGFSRLGAHLINNSQQYFDAEMKLKIAGDAAMEAGEGFLNVSPDMIAGSYNFVSADGTLPIDRFAQVNLWREMIAQMAQVPQVFSQYDMGKIFGFIAQLGGIKNLSRFKVQMTPDDQMAMQAQMGNAVPAEGSGNILEPGQVGQVGPTA